MDFLNGSFKVGRLFGIDIRVHILLVLWMATRLIGANGGDLKWIVIHQLMLFTIILVHEFGHCIGARMVGGDAHVILMWPFGGLAFADAPMRAWPQFVTVACGPLVNVIFCLASGAVLAAYDGGIGWFSLNPLSGFPYVQGPSWLIYLSLFFDVNYFLLAFNLLPFFPMDGGQLLRTFLWPFMGLSAATILSCQIGIAGAIIGGVWGAQNGHFMLVILAFMGGTACWQTYLAARHGAIQEAPSFRVQRRRSEPKAESWWGKILGRGAGVEAPPRRGGPTENPNPGGWEARQSAERALETEVDRILQKVHDQGLTSLSYVERQTLERATRERQRRESDLLEREYRK